MKNMTCLGAEKRKTVGKTVTALPQNDLSRNISDKVGKRGESMIEIVYKENKEQANGNEGYFICRKYPPGR